MVSGRCARGRLTRRGRLSCAITGRATRLRSLPDRAAGRGRRHSSAAPRFEEEYSRQFSRAVPGMTIES